MSLPSNKDSVDPVSVLVAELRAIEVWDVDYWRKVHREEYETLAYAARRERRAEILSYLLSLNVVSTVKEPGVMDRQEVESESRQEKRRHQRLMLEAEVTIRSETGLIPGRAVDVSESGIAAILPVEMPIGGRIELEIKLPTSRVTTRAIVRSRNVFRHGFEFVQPLREVVVHQTKPNDCQNCSGAGFIVKPLDGKSRVAFAHVECRECRGTGHVNQAG